MTLIKSLMLGSAAGIVAIASAQAADLPTKKGAPAAQYVKICTITANGAPITGFILPGSDTCLRISGYITAQIEGGNLNTGYGQIWAPNALARTQTQGITGTANRDSFGFTTRGNLTLDAVSNTAMGPLLGHVEYQFNHGSGFDNTGQGGSDGGLNRAYVTWAGITAGKANSFFSFTGGGPGWANFFSPDRQGFNQPDLLAYTASFGGGFSATISLESQQAGAASGGSNIGIPGTAGYAGNRFGDIVANVALSQGWGKAQLSGVLHQVRSQQAADGTSVNRWGYAIDAGVSFNLPSLGAGDDFLITGAYSRSAIWYSGLPDGMWGEGGAVNGNGTGMILADAAWNGTNQGFATPTAWSISAAFDHHFNPQVSISPLAAYGQVNWSGTGTNVSYSNSKSWILGAVGHYDPVPGLDFEMELLYQNTSSSTPAAFLVGNGVTTTRSFQSKSDGFAARFEITRSF